MGEKEENKKNKKQKHIHPNDQTPNKPTSSDYSFNPTSAVKGLKFGAQFIIKSFTVRRALPPELLHLLHHQPPNYDHNHNKPTPKIFPSTTGYLPTNFTILAHHAWHTLTLGLGTKKSKVILFVFESEGLKSNVDRIWPSEISLGEVNKKMIRGLKGCEMARFKFRKGCVTFYVYAVRRIGSIGFKCGEDLRRILEYAFDATSLYANHVNYGKHTESEGGGGGSGTLKCGSGGGFGRRWRLVVVDMVATTATWQTLKRKREKS
ncbi:hypothetical protein LguiB_029513 [Lonicera macranthoides]